MPCARCLRNILLCCLVSQGLSVKYQSKVLTRAEIRDNAARRSELEQQVLHGKTI
jgi:hypothetical protein